MTLHQHETLDDTIDRLAAAMTAVPADDRFVTRLASRLDESSDGGGSWRLAIGLGVTAAAAIALAMSMTVDREPIQQPSLLVAETRFSLTPRAGVVTPVTPHVASVTAVSAGSAVTDLPPVPAIPALSSLPQLAVGDLELQSLNVAPVELDLLEVANLAVVEIDGAINPSPRD